MLLYTADKVYFALPLISLFLSVFLPTIVHWRSTSPIGTIGYADDCRRFGARGMILAALLSTALWLLVPSPSDFPNTAFELASDRFKLVLGYEIILVMVLIYSVLAVALERGADPKAVSGGPAARKTNIQLDLASRKLQNTLEQVNNISKFAAFNLTLS